MFKEIRFIPSAYSFMHNIYEIRINTNLRNPSIRRLDLFVVRRCNKFFENLSCFGIKHIIKNISMHEQTFGKQAFKIGWK